MFVFTSGLLLLSHGEPWSERRACGQAGFNSSTALKIFEFCLSSGRREPLKRCRWEGKYYFYQHCLIGLADVIITLHVGVRARGCTYREADSSRVGITGQSSLYAVCWAPRQKHCWAVKQPVTETTCSRVEDGQTQTASAAPHQESVPPSSRGLRGLLFDSNATLSFDMEHFYMYRGTQIRNRLSPTRMLQDDEDGCRVRKADGRRKRNAFIWPDTFGPELNTSLAVSLRNVFIWWKEWTRSAPFMPAWHLWCLPLWIRRNYLSEFEGWGKDIVLGGSRGPSGQNYLVYHTPCQISRDLL